MKERVPWIRMIVFSGLFFITHDELSYGQDTLEVKRPNPYWVHLGLGPSSGGMAVGIGFSYEMNGTVVSARFDYCHEGYWLDVSAPSPTEYMADFGILYGIKLINSKVLASLSAGVGVAFGVRRGQFLYNSSYITKVYQEEGYTVVGIPLDAQIFWKFSSTWGIGVYAFGQLNHEESFAGGLVGIRWGLHQ